jgi:hypothetical protein
MKRWLTGQLWPLDPHKVGVNAGTHCRPCACSVCQEDEKIRPMRERAFDYADVP